jgi:hypothetical protein
MAPEQIQGVQVDGRADIYSVGVMLYEMVSGNPPFKADSAMTLMMMHVNDPVPNLQSLRPDTPTDLVRIINKALAKNPNQRYQKAGELARDLRAARLVPPAPIDATRIESAPVYGHPVGATVLETSPSRGPVSSTRQAVQKVPATEVGAAGPRPTAVSAEAQPDENGGRGNLIVFGGIGAVLLLILCLVGALFAYNAISNGDNGEETPVAAEGTPTLEGEEAEATTVLEDTGADSTAAVLTGEALTPVATETIRPTPTSSPTATREPTETPTEANTPTPTTPTGPYVQINGIALENGRYLVEYETIGYAPVTGGQHIHFFFNTVPPAQAGVGPNQGTWFVYFDNSPFTGYGTVDKPANATQMCALVANANHTIVLGTGNCVNLPVG